MARSFATIAQVCVRFCSSVLSSTVVIGFDLFDLLQIEVRAEIFVIVAKVRGEAIHTDVLGTIRTADRHELPLFSMHGERVFECSRA